MRRIAVVANASGSGKTTFGHALAERLGVPFLELDAIAHGPNWRETPADEMLAQVGPFLAGDGWVVDGIYRSKIGTVVWDSADAIVWLDLPVRVWLPRLLRRTIRRAVRREELWNGNRESLRMSFLSRHSVIYFAIRRFFVRRRTYPELLAPYHVIRLCTPREVERFLEQVAQSHRPPARP